MRGRLPALALLAGGLALLACGGSELTGSLSGNQRTIELYAKRYSYSPHIITVNKGETVVLKLISQDVTHGFYLDGYGIEFSVSPGETRTISFKADKSGRFSFRCSSTCGEFHPYMIGYLKVLPNTKYYTGIGLILLLGVASFVVSRRSHGDPTKKLFGFIPLDWRFELTRFRPVRQLFKSRWFPFAFILFNVFIFTVILVAGVVGGLSPGNYNFGVMIVWILWWVLLMTIFVPFIGRFWCMVCPFPVIGDWIQRGKLIGVGRHRSWGLGKRWPRKFSNLWPLTVLFFVSTFFSGFFTVRPFATFLLLGSIILTATIISMIFEKRTFCLYVCPVSGFQGLYANFAACEVRVKDPEICKSHRPKTCYVGSEKGYGCPWMELPYDMNRNTYCGLCLECFKTCPHDNMAFNIRPFGADFLAERRRTDDLYNRRSLDEAFKSLTMIGILFAFFITMQGPYGWIKDMVRATDLDGYSIFVVAYTILNFLLVPSLFLLVCYLSKWASGNKSVAVKDLFVNFSYSLVPIGIARWAAFSIGIMLPNGSYLLHILSDPFAWGWDLFGTARYPWTPIFTGAMPYLQTAVLLVGLAFALEYGYKFAQMTFANDSEARRGWVPMLIFLIALSIFFLWLFGG